MLAAMTQPSAPSRRPGPADQAGRPGLRRLLTLPLVGLIAAVAFMLVPALANADSSSTLTVVGTSDVSDSGLMPNLIQPEFHGAYPQFTFKYVGTATGTAITDAETGVQAASVLIVHAASLENQFVAGGYSYEPYGRAIWTNDFVLAGPSADPAGVGTNASHNIVQAFADIAAAGASGGGTPPATFVSRGGTPGTTVQEHAIWALVDSNGLDPAGVLLCAVSSTDGGGETPIAAGQGVTANGQACPAGPLPGAPSGPTAPPWYQNTGATQGPNVIDANACTTAPATANTCYVFTDRGTYDYLSSGGTPAGGVSEIPNLAILTRNNSASAPGGADELINYFHAYIINPAKSPTPVNLTAAQDFVNFLTSPTLQGQLSSYLNDTSDPGGPPFVADASPTITGSGFPSSIAAGKSVTVTGNVTNVEPNYPALAGKTVSVDELEGLIPVPVATGTTNSTGGYSITFTPASSGSYEVATPQIQQIEDSTLNPVFGDILSPGATAATPISVLGAVSITKTTTSGGSLQVAGTVSPAAPDSNATVTILARPASSSGSFSKVGSESLTTGQTAYGVNGSLAGGKWTIEAQYSDPNLLTTGTSPTQNVTVPVASNKVGFKKVSFKKGKLTLTGSLGQAPVGTSATVKLFALSIGKVSIVNAKGKKTTRIVAYKASAPSFKQVAKATVKAGKTTYTIKHTFKRGFRYVLQLEYTHKGQTSTYSSFKYVDVH
jgi:tungstate transport system substrate-binding protein